MSLGQRHYIWVFVVGCSLMTSACAGLSKGQADLDVGMKERGIASWYGDDFHGWVTASGEIYDMYALTGAHRTLPLGTIVRVTNVVNGSRVLIRVNDRGPYVNGRILDLSYAAAEKLHMVTDGISSVYLEVVGRQGMATVVQEDRVMSAFESSPIRSLPALNTPGSGFLPLSPVAAGERSARQIPSDVLRERRARRAGDIMAADRRVVVAAVL